MIHPLSDVQSNAIGDRTRIWQFCVVLPDAEIGKDCNICSHCFIENDVEIGNRVTVKCGVQIWDGIKIEDDVFIGPNVTFTNDFVPRSRQAPKEFAKSRLECGASIGANATILPGLTIGQWALVAAGAVVTKDVAQYSVMMGSPAVHVGWICKCGIRLKSESLECNCGVTYELTNNQLNPISE